MGQYAALAVLAVGEPPLRYQWSKEGTALTGRTNRHLIISNVAMADLGTYTARVSSGVESVKSLPATLRPVSDVPAGGAVVRFDIRARLPTDPVVAVYEIDGITRLAGTDFAAQLYAGTTLDKLRPIGMPRSFPGGLNHGTWIPEILTLPNVAPGQTYVAQVRAWDWTAVRTYEEARALGEKFGRSAMLERTGAASSTEPEARCRRFPLTLGLPAFTTGLPRLLEQTSDELARELSGAAGFRYLIEKQVDGLNWEPLLILTNATGSVWFRDSIEPRTAELVIYRSRMLD